MALDLVAHHIDERGAFLHLNMAHQDCCFYRGTVLYAFSMSLSLFLSWAALGFRTHQDLQALASSREPANQLAGSTTVARPLMYPCV